MSGTKRRDAGTGSVYQLADGSWRGSIELGMEYVGKDEQGEPIYRRNRKVVKRKTKSAVVAELKRLRERQSAGATVAVNVPTAGAWLRHWIAEVRPHGRTNRGPVRPKTVQADRSLVEQHLIPFLDRYKLEELEQRPAIVLELHKKLRAKPATRGDGTLEEATVLRAHAVLSRALDDAITLHGYISRNPCKAVGRPGRGTPDIDFLDAAQSALLLAYVVDKPNGSRWGFAELTGKRQGECLGLRRSFVHLDDGYADVSWQLQRLGWRHACNGDGARDAETTCGRRFAGNCPDRVLDVPADYEHIQLDGGLCLTRPKGSIHIVPLIPSMAAWLAKHMGETPAGPYDMVWARPDGRPIDPRHDYDEFIGLLDALGLRRVRLHSLRHSCATLLLSLGIPEPVIMQIVGHSTVAAARRYQHVDITAARAALRQLGQVLRLEPAELTSVRQVDADLGQGLAELDEELAVD